MRGNKSLIAIAGPLTILGFVACQNTAHKSSSDSGTQKIKITNGQVQIAKFPRREFPLDLKIPACEDMYAHVCSEATKSFQMRADRSRHLFAFSDAEEYLLEVKKSFLASLASENATLSSRKQKLFDAFAACMNVDASRSEESAFVQGQLKEIQSLPDREAFKKFVAGRILSEDMGFLGLARLPNIDQPLKYDVLLISSLQSLPERSYYARPDLMEALKGLITFQFKTLGLENSAARAEKVLAFEKRFSDTFPLPEQFRERLVQRRQVRLDKLISLYPNLQLKQLTGKGEVSLSSRLMTRDLAPENLKFLDDALAKEDLQLLKDALTWRSLASAMDDAYPEYFQAQFAFDQKFLGGAPKRPERDERCTEMVKSNWGRELDAELLPAMFPDFPKSRVVRIAEKVRGSILSSLEKNKWLTVRGKAGAVKKIKSATLHLVSPSTEEEWDFNPPVEVSKDKPLGNLRALRKAQTLKVLAEFRHPRNPNVWDMGPLTVNAYYDPTSNKFVLPIGILQPPFFDAKLSDELNMASVGSVIAHELGHAIDDKGARYDEKGRLKDWMSPADLKRFADLSLPLVKQFDEAGMNGTFTLGENIGDLVGLSFSYNAAFANAAKTDAKTRADLEKDFFRQYARSWCEVVRPDYATMLVKVDPHSSGKHRANQQMKHQTRFQQAFDCKPGNALYLPEDKRVTVW
jgi:putative endopeptidase